MIIRLEPIPLSKIWGGDKLSKTYGFSLSNIGEIWGISAHKSHSNKIINGDYKGMSFRELFINHREYFGHYPKEEFPLLFKVIDAAGDLSVQVHPDDDYACANEGTYGKDECWYILEADAGSRIQIGHKAKSLSDIKNSISKDSLVDLLKYHTIKTDDLFYIPSGKVHAICKNTTLLEISQASDITYRLYDYKRLYNGKLRELHIEKALDVLTVPDNDNMDNCNIKYFNIDILDICEEKSMLADYYGDYIYVIKGNGSLDNERISEGEFIFITSISKYLIAGKIKIAIVKINK